MKNHNKFISHWFWTILILILLSFSSCGNYVQEMWIEKDGSGRLKIEVDASAMLEMMDMMGEKKESKNTDDPIAKFLASSETQFDTLISFYDIAPDSVKQEIENPDLMRKAKMSMQMDKDEGTFIIGVQMDYKNLEEADQIINEIKKSRRDNSLGDASMIATPISGGNFSDSYELSKGLFIQKSSSMEDSEIMEIGGEEGKKDLAMVTSMMGQSSIIYIYHFSRQGKVH